MDILNERSISIKNPMDAAAVFGQIEQDFHDIASALLKLNNIFISEKWNLKESQQESLALYQRTVKDVRDNLTNLSLINSKLSQFLVNEERPTPIKITVSKAIDIWTETINKCLRLYYHEIKGTFFPNFDNEIKQHKDIVEKINLNIDRINEINRFHGRGSVKHIKNLSI